MGIISLKNISKIFYQNELITEVLDDVNLEIEAGEFVAIQGASGSGKSTLLHIMGLLDSPTSGTYILNGLDVSQLGDNERSELRNRMLGFLFQSFYLIPYATTMENVMLPGLYTQSQEKILRARAKELLVQVGLGERMEYKPGELSGGQQQRVALARALLNDPEILLADEPTGQLDSATGREIMELFKEVNKRGKTVILVTHDAETASYAERKVVISDGRVVD